MQRLEMFIAVMLARERRWHADTAADCCTELAAALVALPSLTLEKVADAVVALDCATAGNGVGCRRAGGGVACVRACVTRSWRGAGS